MGTATEQLMGMANAPDRFSYSPDDILKLQIKAMDERFQSRKDSIKLLGHRANDAGITAINSPADMVPLLFPHTAYKSYPESFLMGEKWDRLSKWLETVSPYPITPMDYDSINGIDEWIDQLESNGHYVSCSSGTTGKSAMLIASEQDATWWRRDIANVFSWGSGVEQSGDYRLMGLAPVASVPKNRIMGESLEAAFGDPDREHYRLNMPPITVGKLVQMVVLRKKIADGSAEPEEIASLQKIGKERETGLEQAMNEAADALVRYRDEKLMISGMWASLYQVAALVRELGFSAKDFNPDNCIYVGGGLKRAQLPEDYKEFVLETFNIPAERDFQMYSMQEINSGMPRCREGGRYHVPPWLVPLVLDEAGEKLLDYQSGGEVEGRAAFFDISQDGSWGGVISGDKISIDYSPCKCGNSSPSIADNIARYADLKDGDDKIACSGTVDAYVRGVS